MFDNIVFDEFTLLEGEQAEAYKKKKEKEKWDDSGIKYRNTWSGSYDVGQGYKTKGESKSHRDYMKNAYGRAGDQSTQQEKDNNKRMLDSKKKAQKEAEDRRYGKHNNKTFKNMRREDIHDSRETLDAADAINRHERKIAKRKAKHEAALAMIEAYEPEFIY